MSGITVTVDGVQVAISRLQASREAVEKALAATAVQVEDYIEGEIGRHAKTGALERSLQKRRITDGWEVFHDSQVAPHARFVHDGTRPHVILPRKRKVLRWPVPGAFAFAKRVNHPGYPGDPWLRRAANLAVPTFERALNARLQGV